MAALAVNMWFIPEMDVCVNCMAPGHAKDTFVKHAFSRE